jgi:periplasmic protein TonB
MALSLQHQKLYDQQRQRTAFLLAISITFLVIVGMYLWRVKFFDFPLEMELYGMEISFGTDKVGSGARNIPIDQVVTREENSNQPNEPQNKTQEQVQTNDNSEKSDVNIPVKKEEKKNQIEKQETKSATKTDKKPTQTENGNSTTPGQGNDDQPGTKGKPNGVNEAGLYDGNGGRGGSSLSLRGWKWEKAPIVNDLSSETGKIVFSIMVDQDGYFITAKVVSSTVSSREVVEKYRLAILQSTLTPDESVNSNSDEVSRGTVTIILRAK